MENFNYKKIINHLICFFIICLQFSFALSVQAGLLKSDSEASKQTLTNSMVGNSGLDTTASVTSIAGTAIKAFIGMLAIIFLILVIVGGWKYFNARGNDEKVTESLATIRHAVIGLIIITGAYVITYFIFKNLPGGTSTIQGTR